MATVIFWDIDGTLLSTGGAGRFAWAEATEEVCGRPLDPAAFTTAGLTDVEIAADIWGRLGDAGDHGQIDRLIRRYEALLPERLPWKEGMVLPGVREILEDLGQRPGVASLLLTGNTEAGGRAKLRYYGLDEYFTVGAFADGTTDRVAIARKGWALASQALGSALEPDRAFVVGDTPHDIRCARAIGVRAVAVATGAYTTVQLGAHEPWWVIDQLPSSEKFAERLGLGYTHEASPDVRPADQRYRNGRPQA